MHPLWYPGLPYMESQVTWAGECGSNPERAFFPNLDYTQGPSTVPDRPHRMRCEQAGIQELSYFLYPCIPPRE